MQWSIISRPAGTIRSARSALTASFRRAQQPDYYSVKLQSRGGNSVGPRADADVNVVTGDAHVTLYDLKFDTDFRAMLPAEVRNWWRDHGLAGDVKKTELWLNPSGPTKVFKANISLDSVAMTVQPEELLSRDEIQSRAWTRQAFDVMRTAGLDGHGFVSRLSESLDAKPILLKNVDGDFTFTQDGVDINQLEATIEDNRFAIQGHYDGYRNDAAASLTVSNPKGRVIVIPAHPSFMNSLPAEIREAYTRFRPQGTCDISATYVRPSPGAAPQVTCEVNVLDGDFIFERFPYPICKATGKVIVDRDETTGQGRLRIEKIRGHGAHGGPNEKASIEIDGEMGPFTPAIDVKLVVAGKNISSEPSLIAAFPPRTRQALSFFDSAGKGEFPKFRGDFNCSIRRFPEVVSNWNVETSIHLKDAAGSVVAFPYPLEQGTGELVIGEDHMTIKDVHFKHGDADVLVKGRVDWASDEERARHPTTQSTLRPTLSITASNVPIDDTLIARAAADARQVAPEAFRQGQV